jgi:putative ABC transport system permease protein
MRTVPVRLHYGPRFRNVSIIGLPAVPELNRIVDRSGKAVALPEDGLLMSRTLADLLNIKIGSRVELEVLEGKRPLRETTVSGLVDEYLGLSVYMNRSALHKLMREDEIISGAYLKIDQAESLRLYKKLKNTPRIAGMNLTTEALKSFERTMDQNMGLQITISVVFAAIIAFGVVYNAARISLSERSRELASLRVLGFTRGEISLILLGELALLTLAALPLGVLLGHLMSKGILSAVESELYRFPYVMTIQNIARSCLIVAVAAAFSGLVVRRKLDRLDLIAVLKTPE